MFSRDVFDREPEREALVRRGREIRVVARGDDRRSGLPNCLLQQPDEHAPRDAVEVGRRLVGQQHARPGRECSRDRHPPLLAAGEAIGATVAEAAEPHPFEPALRSGTRLVARDVRKPASVECCET